MDGEAWWAAVHGVVQSWTRLTRLSSSSRQVFLLILFFKIHLATLGLVMARGLFHLCCSTWNINPRPGVELCIGSAES